MSSTRTRENETGRSTPSSADGGQKGVSVAVPSSRAESTRSRGWSVVSLADDDVILDWVRFVSFLLSLLE